MAEEKFIGERLRQLRVINDKSLQEVGTAVSATKQYIQQLEAGLQQPTSMTLGALSDFFDAPQEFFMKKYNRIYETDCYFRKAKSTPFNIREKAEQYASLLEEYVNFLDEDVYDLPRISFLNREFDYKNLSPLDIENAADDLRRSWNLDDETPIENMTNALENAGAIVTSFTELLDKIDAFSINRKRPLVIKNNEKNNACRLRFSLAHECGHLVLHKNIENSFDEEIKEEQANRFASALLLPRKGFMQEFGQIFSNYRIDWKYLLKLKERWKVSFSAMIHRAYDLNMINALKYRNAYIYLRKSGQAKEENGDKDVLLENASLLRGMTNDLLDNDREKIYFFIDKQAWPIYLFNKVVSTNLSKIGDPYKNIINIDSYKLK